jgi:hypothetical protein
MTRQRQGAEVILAQEKLFKTITDLEQGFVLASR